MNLGGFSWRRFIGVSAFKAKISRAIGIPLSRSGRQRKIGAYVEQLISVGIVIVFNCIAKVFKKKKSS